MNEARLHQTQLRSSLGDALCKLHHRSYSQDLIRDMDHMQGFQRIVSQYSARCDVSCAQNHFRPSRCVSTWCKGDHELRRTQLHVQSVIARALRCRSCEESGKFFNVLRKLTVPAAALSCWKTKQQHGDRNDIAINRRTRHSQQREKPILPF